MSPPTSIDGTDIIGATIDGEEVQEITVDGQTVFSAGLNIPVAYNDLIAWYNFDAGFYGGNALSDYTAIVEPGLSGDSTPYNGSSGQFTTTPGHVTDINAGSSSIGLEGNDDFTVSDNSGLEPSTLTISAWTRPTESSQSFGNIVNRNSSRLFFLNDFGFALRYNTDVSGQTFIVSHAGSSTGAGSSVPLPINEYHMLTGTFDGSDVKIYVNGNLQSTETTNGKQIDYKGGDMRVGSGDGGDSFKGDIDDVRFYNRALSASEISQIYNRTEP